MLFHDRQGSKTTSPLRLARADVHANRTGVVVLEVVERVITRAAHLVRDSLSSSTIARDNGVGVARRDAHTAEVALLAGYVGPASRLHGRAAELGEAAGSAARCGVAGGLEILLLGEEEDDGALLARVGGGDVEVEDGAGRFVNLAVVRGTIGLIGRSGIDRDDQVRVLIVTI